VVVKVRERLAVNKWRSQRFDMETFSLKKLNDAEGKEQFRVEVSNRFAALEDLDVEVEINSAWETIERIKISTKESLGYFEQDMKPADISGIKRGNIRKTKLMSLQLIVRTRTSEACIEE
jgi:hypothetical protein